MKKILLLTIFVFIIAYLAGCGILPASKNIDVPFTSQAPAGNWSEPWKNACEETSIYMVSSFYADDTIKRDEAIKHIKEILAAKNKEFQISKDESLEKISELIALLGLPWKTEIVVNPSLEDIKKQLVDNQPIIAPVFAPALHYTAGGPDYHVMVITGYDDSTNEFIVNDPALKNGKGIRFDYDVFMKEIHDLNQTNYKAGKNALLFTKQEEGISWF
ncbi:MAG: hypothetical protein US42_C0002G0004 [Candidatus Magasanikbacteria bacterium GW2011_GWC2_37_14]|uniref:Peptidase C39-like domain-containing protein n=1 Tax=Candidatus Magasanikbacteria bacterium GW2011_GWC2_37_14 TaxID=1619046 RepID=A0A0G0IV56_9BACT|nr:MAG: hypothetical protein US42_C0002G0004 [Candidatus Magasanikbacteria bacterium GW2011_GWC2_37_14]